MATTAASNDAPSRAGKRLALDNLQFNESEHELYKQLEKMDNIKLILQAARLAQSPDALSMEQIQALPRVRKFANFVDEGRTGATNPLQGFGFDEVVAAATEACTDVTQIIHFAEPTYKTPSPQNLRQPGCNRPVLLGRALQHVLKASAQSCFQCGESFADYKAKSQHWSAVHFDHREGETKLYDPSHCAALSVDVAMAEYAKCEILCAKCHHHGGTKKGSKVGKKPVVDVSYLMS